mgnify:CR=1 FL=1
MKKILMCGSARTEKGGINSVIDQLMNHKWDDNLEFSYLATHKSGNNITKILFFINAYKQLKRLIKKNSFDIIHIHMSYNGSFYRKYYVAKLCKKNNKKIIIHLHGSEFKDFYNFGNRRRKNMIVELFSIADCTIVLGHDWEKFIKSIALSANVKVVNNAVKLPEYKDRIRHDKCTFLFLGALIKRKGVIDLLEALKKINMHSYKLVIAGAGEEEALLKQFCEKNNMNNCVEFLGWIDNNYKPKLFEKVDVMVLPSYNEGLPIAILEALSFGLPIISTDVGSIKEAVENKKNGFLFRPGDIVALKESLEILINDIDLWKSFSISSRRIAEEKFSENRFFECIEKIYLTI